VRLLVRLLENSVDKIFEKFDELGYEVVLTVSNDYYDGQYPYVIAFKPHDGFFAYIIAEAKLHAAVQKAKEVVALLEEGGEQLKDMLRGAEQTRAVGG
jgi:hypothetical protein